MTSDPAPPAATARQIPIDAHLVHGFEPQPSRWPLFLHRPPIRLAGREPSRPVTSGPGAGRAT
jgi:hypothetical protein